jgi:hypothetical protein
MSFFGNAEQETNALETGKATFKRLFSGSKDKDKKKEVQSAPAAPVEQPSYFAAAERGGQPQPQPAP